MGGVFVYTQEGGSLMHRKLTVVTLILAAVLLPAFGAYGDISLNYKLIYAAENGDYKAVEALLKAGADVNAEGYYRHQTALMCAAKNGHADIAELLLKRGANINAKGDDGETALMLAKSAEIAELLLKHGADVNAKSDFLGETALMLAAESGYTDVTELLLKHGANVNAKSKEGWTALMYAAMGGHIKIVNILIGEGAYVNAREKGGHTALMYAAFYEDDDKASEIASILIEAGAHINTKTIGTIGGAAEGWSAVMFAECQRNTKTVSVLRKAGALGKLTPKQRDDYINFILSKGN